MENDLIARLKEVLRRAKERSGYATVSGIVIELIGFSPPNVITEEDRRYLRGETKQDSSKAKARG